MSAQRAWLGLAMLLLLLAMLFSGAAAHAIAGDAHDAAVEVLRESDLDSNAASAQVQDDDAEEDAEAAHDNDHDYDGDDDDDDDDNENDDSDENDEDAQQQDQNEGKDSDAEDDEESRIRADRRALFTFNHGLRARILPLAVRLGGHNKNPWRMFWKRRNKRLARRRENKFAFDRALIRNSQSYDMPKPIHVANGRHESGLFKCLRSDCHNPTVCFNSRNQRISNPSRKMQRAVLRDGLWWKRKGSFYAWQGCRWRRQRPRCNPKTPKLHRIGGKWRRRPYWKTRNYVKRRGKWYRNAASNLFWKNCRWVRERARRNCTNPTLRMLAGRWIKRSRTYTRHMYFVRGRWYLGRGRRYVYRNCHWVKRNALTARQTADEILAAQQDAAKEKRRLRREQRKLVRMVGHRIRRFQRRFPMVGNISKMRKVDIKKAARRVIPHVGRRLTRDFIRYFMHRYVPHAPERINYTMPISNPAKYYNLPYDRFAKMRTEPPPPGPNGNGGNEIIDLNPLAVEDNEAAKPMTVADFYNNPIPNFLPPRDRLDPERGIDDYEPGVQYRNKWKTSHEQLHVIGEEETLRNPGEADSWRQQPKTVANDPSLSYHR